MNIITILKNIIIDNNLLYTSTYFLISTDKLIEHFAFKLWVSASMINQR